MSKGVRRLYLRELALIQIRIKSAHGKQRLMISLLDDITVFHNKDHIRLLDRRQPVRYDKTGPAFHHGCKSLLDLNFGSCIDRGCRFVNYDVDEGAICVSGHDIREVTRKSLRESYGMVLQETWLKTGTIRENIIMGKPDATNEEVIAAAKASHAHSFIKSR
mgnify:CR=1 FL=1